MTRPDAIDDVSMMADEDRWPHWPVLPVKRRTPDGLVPEIGVLVGGFGPRVFKVSMFQVPGTKEELEQLESEQSVDMVGLVDKGWRVD